MKFNYSTLTRKLCNEDNDKIIVCPPELNKRTSRMKLDGNKNSSFVGKRIMWCNFHKNVGLYF